MEKSKDCKILFSTLVERMWKNKKDDELVTKPLFKIQEIVKFIVKQSRLKRFYNLKDGKFCFIESAEIVEANDDVVLISGFFKSARSEFRPNLINRRTAAERKNPKEITEGDIEKTHFVIKCDKAEDEVYLLLENNFHGVSLNSVVNYLNQFFYNYTQAKSETRKSSIDNFVIPSENFLKQLKRLNRTTVAEVYFDKKLLGTKALNFSNKTISIKKEIKLTATATVRESITEFAVDVFNSLNSTKSDISKVRVYGVDKDKNKVMLDSSFMSRIEHVSVDLNVETGEVNTTELLVGMRTLASKM